ncbi:MAG: hypothetical protein V7K21_01990 [Nostoc sp.]|uniref:hypothetical protein n=1 Tax=Nostoc sp. TaxID=1180 RepID=UPI002FFB6A7D
MESQTSQQAVIEPQKLQHLQDEIQQEISKILNNSNLSNVLEKYGILKDKILTIQYSIDLSKMQSNDVIADQQHQEFLPEALGQNKRQLQCWVVNGGCVTYP